MYIYDHDTRISSIKDFNARIERMKTIMDKKDSQPWGYTQYFEDVKDQEDPMHAAMQIALAYKEVYGPVIVESEESYCAGTLLTIMDTFADGEDCDEVSNWLLKRAFKELGYKRGEETNQADMLRAYHATGRIGFCTLHSTDI